ncbi:hypothetical protein NC651_022892 [Populus alba x Populus x berolinensis]|nr:hypothetical protein NC651_022892 [Populus alba x Populus x berolinensis]
MYDNRRRSDIIHDAFTLNLYHIQFSSSLQ